MPIKKIPPQPYFLLFFIFLLVACTPAQTTPSLTNAENTAIALTQAVTSTPISTATLVHMPTVTLAIPLATLTPTPSVTLSPTPLPSRTPLPASLPTFPLDGYVLLFIEDEKLYFQDGENEPVKLTHIGERNSYPYSPKLSDDNQKVLFSRENGNIYSINTDGTDEQVIIPNDWLDTFEAGTEMKLVSFVPDTHIVFLKTFFCEEKEITSLCSTSTFLADTETSEIEKLADLGMVQQKVHLSRNIEISPDGKMLAVGTMDGVKILALDGKIVRRYILPYTPSKSSTFFPSLFWLPNSQSLIIANPDKIHPDPFYVGNAPAYSLWRYTITNDTKIQISLEPPVAGRDYNFEISPDGNWIVYGGLSPAAAELYLGNLADGSSKEFGSNLRRNFQWSSDSKYFIYGGNVVVSFDKPPLDGGAGPAWVDSNHFIYVDIPESNPMIQQERLLVGEIKGDEVYYYDLEFSYPFATTIKPKK